MNIKRIRWGIIILLVIAFCVQYSSVNKGVPKDYKIDSYNIGDEINIDGVILTINGFSVKKRELDVDGDNNYEIILSLIAMNRSDTDISLESLLGDSKLSYGFYYQDYCEAEGDLKKIDKLSASDNMNLSLKYILPSAEVEKCSDRDKYIFYISKNFISDDVQKEYADGYLYGLCVELGEIG